MRHARKNRGPAVERYGAALMIAALSACHTYVPAPASPTPGSSVRAQLTAPGALRMAEITGSPRTTLEGKVIDGGGANLTLEVPIPGIVPELQRNPKIADTLAIALSDIIAVEQQEFSRTRTTLLGTTIVALMVGALLVADAGGSTGPVGPGGNEPQTFAPPSVPISIIRIPIGYR